MALKKWQVGRYNVRVFEAKEVGHPGGDNGEQFIVFVRDWKNPLDSGWSFHHTKEEAEAAAANYRKETDKIVW